MGIKQIQMDPELFIPNASQVSIYHIEVEWILITHNMVGIWLNTAYVILEYLLWLTKWYVTILGNCFDQNLKEASVAVNASVCVNISAH